MKKIIILFFVSHFCTLSLYAQKELWGVYKGYPSYTVANDVVVPANFGSIIKYDNNGENPIIMHQFDGIHGLFPEGRLFMASNGKIYGSTTQGGINETIIPNFVENAYGVIYEYDPILNKFRVVYNFDSSIFPRCPRIGFIEPIPNKLYGATANRLITYDLITEATTIYGGLNYLINSELMKASDGNLYGTVIRPFETCPNSSSSNLPYNGSIIKIVPSSNTININYSLSCNWALGAKPSGELVEVSPGKLFGTTDVGGILPNSAVSNYGVIFEYNFLTNTYTKKFDFDKDTTGSRPSPLIKGLNGNLYGACVGYGTCTSSSTEGSGTLFEFNPNTNALTVLKTFGCGGNLIANPSSLMKSSTGDFFGTVGNDFGVIFKYNPVTNTCSMGTSPKTENLIEICRKPSYQEFIPNTFSPCVNTPFTYNIQNTNATSYVWKKDGVVVPLQTTGILTINNLIASDTGIYTCTMTNECGTTTTMNLNVTLNCLDNETFVNDKNEIILYPNPTKNTISIHLPENEIYEIKEITIANILGQKVIGDIKNAKNIDVSSLQKGIYILQLKTDKGDWNGKFVKE
ncbi:choice-of-anchor tandem repeat GloVer-containing protein [Flavobacterium sp.]|uniref:choice-of-anchor tandem repeat GloVer-containing protein n=1 Tax=Flavobacterium sp. TaxID=239 RepID=UPI003751B443